MDYSNPEMIPYSQDRLPAADETALKELDVAIAAATERLAEVSGKYKAVQAGTHLFLC